MAKIDKNIPLPSGRSVLYGFGEMELGDSIFIPAMNAEEKQKARHAPGVYKNGHEGWNYVTQTRVENGVPGVRVWRTEPDRHD